MLSFFTWAGLARDQCYLSYKDNVNSSILMGNSIQSDKTNGPLNITYLTVSWLQNISAKSYP